MVGNAEANDDTFWKLGARSDAELLERLHELAKVIRRSTAELVAHLAEIDERRLHLELGYAGLFDFCVRRLGCSEDEAYRRSRVARLARVCPDVYTRLAAGELSLAVAALIEPGLGPDRTLARMAALAHLGVTRAREVLAELEPCPDVAARIRKLPSRLRCGAASPSLGTALAAPVSPREQWLPGFAPATTPGVADAATARAPSSRHAGMQPLGADRYKVQFTASAAFKAQIELATDLLRHAVPRGELATILSRALELLTDDLMKRRFGQRNTPERSTPHAKSASISRRTRRAVAERDGLCCSWVGPDGTRCNARAWLELDHRVPRGKGGSSTPENLRPFCRNHNRLAAEHEFGRAHVEHAITRRRARSQVPTPEVKPPPLAGAEQAPSPALVPAAGRAHQS